MPLGPLSRCHTDLGGAEVSASIQTHKVGSGQEFLGGADISATSGGPQQARGDSSFCSSGGVSAPSTTQFTVILKTVSAVRCKAALALLRWSTPEQAAEYSSSPCACHGSGLGFPVSQAKHSPVWLLAASSPEKSPRSTQAAIPKEELPWQCGIRWVEQSF